MTETALQGEDAISELVEWCFRQADEPYFHKMAELLSSGRAETVDEAAAQAIALLGEDGGRLEQVANALLSLSQERDRLREALEGVMPFVPIGFAATGRPEGADDRNAALDKARDVARAALNKEPPCQET